MRTRIESIPIFGYISRVLHDVATLKAVVQEKELETAAAIQELRGLEQHTAALAQYARRSQRDYSELKRDLATACERIAALELKVAAILEMLHGEMLHGEMLRAEETPAAEPQVHTASAG